MTAPDDSGGPEVAALRAAASNHAWGLATDPSVDPAAEVERLRAENRALRDTNERIVAESGTLEARYAEAAASDRRTLQDALAAQSTVVTGLTERVAILLELRNEYQRYVRWLEAQIEDPGRG